MVRTKIVRHGRVCCQFALLRNYVARPLIRAYNRYLYFVEFLRSYLNRISTAFIFKIVLDTLWQNPGNDKTDQDLDFELLRPLGRQIPDYFRSVFFVSFVRALRDSIPYLPVFRSFA